MSNRSRVIVVGLLSCALGSCIYTGPSTVRVDRSLYSAAIQQTNKEQLLLNLVRLRYMDIPHFLQVASVTTSFSFETSGLAAGVLHADPNTASIAIGGGVKESPTVTYAPLQGEQFVRQLMEPIDLSTILLLSHSGWSIERVFRICLQSLGGIPNAPSASGPTPKRPPKFKEFLRVVRLLRSLQRKRVLALVRQAEGPQQYFALRLAPAGVDSGEMRELTSILNLTPGRSSYRLIPNSEQRGPDSIGIETRSLLSGLFYLSHGTNVPPADEASGILRVTIDESGNPFDWRSLFGDFLQIRVSDDPPEGAAVSALYRGRWFFISDADFESKSTFGLLGLLFSLSAGDVRGVTPALTIPVAR